MVLSYLTLLLSSIGDAVWLLFIAAAGVLLVIVGVGWRFFVAKASTTEGKMARLGLLLLAAPVLAYALFCWVLGLV